MDTQASRQALVESTIWKELVARHQKGAGRVVHTLVKRLSASSKSFNKTATWLSSADRLVVMRPNFLCMLCILDGWGSWVKQCGELGSWGAQGVAQNKGNESETSSG
jgi:hypothetical protein